MPHRREQDVGQENRGDNVNNKNLKHFTSNQSHEEAVKNGAKGGKASGEAKKAKKTARQIAEMLDSLPVTGKNKELLDQLGIPEDDKTQQTVRLLALHKKAILGDVRASRLWLEIIGEAPTQKVEVYSADDKTREAYEKAAAAIRGSGKKK